MSGKPKQYILLYKIYFIIAMDASPHPPSNAQTGMYAKCVYGWPIHVYLR